MNIPSVPRFPQVSQKTSTPATLTWNALAQPITVNSTSATYDALGRMVEKGLSGTYTQFVYRPSGAQLAVYSGGLVKGAIPLPGGSTAVYNSTGVNFIRHKDWLGSSRLATTWAHAVFSKEAYAPFGETYNEAGTADRSFTGQDQDLVSGSGGTGAYDFLFRKYDPSAGRWLSPDPYGWNAVNQSAPQSLNRYAYVMNNPMSLTDPEGLDCVWQNADGTVSTSTGDCPTTGDGANGTYIDCDGCVMAGTGTFDNNGDLNGYCTSGGCNDGNGNPVAPDPNAPQFRLYGFGTGLSDLSPENEFISFEINVVPVVAPIALGAVGAATGTTIPGGGGGGGAGGKMTPAQKEAWCKSKKKEAYVAEDAGGIMVIVPGLQIPGGAELLLGQLMDHWGLTAQGCQ